MKVPNIIIKEIDLNDYIKPINGDNILCPVCNGKGVEFVFISLKGSLINETCHNCKGLGVLDWCRRLVLGIRNDT